MLNDPDGIILLSGSVNGLICKLFDKAKFTEINQIYKNLKEKFKDNFYIEIQRHNDVNEKSFEFQLLYFLNL